MYIDTSEALAGFVGRASQADVIAIDTEFIRERTYYPKLCLVQMAVSYGAEEELVIVDPLSIADISAIGELLLNEKIVKVFHSCDQDIAILYHSIGCLPKPIFDTQRGAQLLGHVQQIGLGAMVKSFCDIIMDKSDTYTDWAQRPLSATQMEYAYNDVRFLPRIYRTMSRSLQELGRLSWLDEEFERLCSVKTYENDIRSAWRKVRHSASLKPRQLNALRELAAWREKIAIQRNYPKKWVATDETLVEIARRLPQTLDELYQVRGAREKLSRSWSNAIVAAVQTALATPSSEWPELERTGPVSRPRPAQIDLVTALVRHRASENKIAHGILASHDEICALAGGRREGLEVLTGWRLEMVGKELIELLKGNICLSLVGDELCVRHETAGES